jgi:hypothetical protein
VSADVFAPGTLDTLARALAGKLCLVVGAAPLAEPLELPTGVPIAVVAVNGGISSVPSFEVDVWVVNSRAAAWEHWGAERLRLANLMLAQGRGKHADLVVFLAREDEAPAITATHLRKQGTTWDHAIALSRSERHELEVDAGGRTRAMEKHALSAGLTAVSMCLLAGAAHVRLVGFSWTPGYQYAPGDRAVESRGHEAGDKAALRSLEARYGTVLEHNLFPDRETPMADKTQAAQPPKGGTPPAAASSPAPAVKPAKPGPGFKVRATKMVWYDNARRREGDVFLLRSASDFKRKCMARVDDRTPVKAQRASDVIRQRDAEHAARSAGSRGGAMPALAANAADFVDTVGTGVVDTGNEDDRAID